MKCFTFIIGRLSMVSIVTTALLLSIVPMSSGSEAETDKISSVMAEKIANKKKSVVAVVDFTDLQGEVTELGRFLAEEISVSLAGSSKGFKVIDRINLKSIIKEHKLAETGIIKLEDARKLGQIAGVEALVTGTLTPLGDSVQLSVKLLDTSTAEIIDANKGSIAKTKAITELLERSIPSGNNPSSVISARVAGKNDKTPMTKECKGVVFDLVECKRDGNGITCNFIITSKEKDREVWINNKSRVIDDMGNEFRVDKMQLGNDSGSCNVSVKLPADIPVKAHLTFNISSQASALAILEVRSNNEVVQYRNVSFPK